MPFGLLSYALGLTRLRLRDVLLGSVGTLPGIALYTSVGAAFSEAAELSAGGAEQAGSPLLFGLGLGATVLATVLIGRAARRALDQELGEE